MERRKVGRKKIDNSQNEYTKRNDTRKGRGFGNGKGNVIEWKSGGKIIWGTGIEKQGKRGKVTKGMEGRKGTK